MKKLLTVLFTITSFALAAQNRIDISAQTEIGTEGDIILLDGAGEQTYLAIGANGTVLTSDGTTASWVAPASSTFTAAGDSGTNQTITGGDTFTIRGDAVGAITTVGTATDIMEIDLLLDEQANGVDISQTATGLAVAPDYSEYTTETAFDGAADFAVFYDASATTQKKILLSNLTWSLTDGTTTETVGLGNTVTLVNAATDGFDLTVSATDQVTFTYDWPELTTGDVMNNAADLIMYYDDSAGDYKTSTLSNASAYENNTVITNTANTTLDATHNVVEVVASTTASTIDLPDAATVAGRIYTIKAEDVTNAVTVDPSGAQTIDGAATYSFSNADDVIQIQSDGANWVVVSEKTQVATSSFTATGDGGAAQTISSGDNFVIRGDAAGAITTVGTATDIMEIDLLLDEQANGLDISQTATGLAIAPDYLEYGLETTFDAANDFGVFYDASAGVQKRIALSNLSFSITDGTTTETVGLGNTITYDDATARGIDVTVTATDQVNVALDIDELTETTTFTPAADYIAVADGGTTNKATFATIMAGTRVCQAFANHSSATLTMTGGNMPTTAGTEHQIEVFVNGVREYDNDYGAAIGQYTQTSATVLTLDYTPASAEVLVCYYITP